MNLFARWALGGLDLGRSAAARSATKIRAHTSNSRVFLLVNPQEGPLVRPLQPRWFYLAAAVAVAVACLALSMRGQTGASAPPTASKASATVPNAPQAQSPQVTTIRAYSNLVVIDVVVNDAQGNPVHGLTRDDFTLLENNKPQTVRHFEEHSATAATAAPAAKAEPLEKLHPGVFTNESQAPGSGPVNVLLLDYLNTPLTYQPYARKQLLEYLTKAPAGTRIAIFALTNRLIMLQGFTSDMEVLKKALLSKQGTPQASDILTDPMNGGSMTDTTLSDAMAYDPTAVQGMITDAMIQDVARFEALQTSFEQDLRQRLTLSGFDLLARYLVGIPGRKNVIWFSGGFPLDVEPDVRNDNDAHPTESVVRNDEEVRKTDNLLTRAQIAVYPVDARGVMTDPSQNFGSQSMSSQMNIDGSTGASTASAAMGFLEQTASEHETMYAMAEDTGGQAFVNTNGLTQAVTKAIENGSNYYTLTYTPTNTVWDARFRSIKIKVDKPGIKLAYRNGYYAIDPNDRNALAAQGAATALNQPTTMATAMLHGGPDPAEILFKVRIRPADGPPEDTPLKSNQTNPDPKVKVQGPYKEYGVDLVPDPHAVKCPLGADGNHHCALEVWTFVYNSDGEKLITASNRLHTLLTPTEYAKLLSGGMAFHQQVSVPVRGLHYLRTAIHDMDSDNVGAVEVPVAAVASLEPIKVLPAQLPRRDPTSDPAQANPAPVPVAPAATPKDAAPSTAPK
jgi:VWFA-related protein